MKSFAVLAATIGAASAQAALGSCAQLCVDNMATIASTQFQCGAGDVACFCNQSNWAYGVRDCSRQACSVEESAQAVAWAAGQCNGVAENASGSLAAVPILTGALASATGAAPSVVASVTASEASGILASGSSAASDALESASSAAASAVSSASDRLNSATSALASAASSAASAVSSVANPPNAAAPMQTSFPVVAGAGLMALFFL